MEYGFVDFKLFKNHQIGIPRFIPVHASLHRICR